MTAVARIAGSPHRRSMIAKVHLGAKELALTDDMRRDVMEKATGKRSAADLSDAQLVLVLDAYKRLGWPAANGNRPKAAPPPGPKPADHPVARKARAMWISLHQLGVVHDRRDSALEHFAQRQLRVTRFQWADQSQGYRLIEALKAMATRAGWDQDLSGVAPELHVSTLKARLDALLAKRAADAELETP